MSGEKPRIVRAYTRNSSAALLASLAGAAQPVSFGFLEWSDGRIEAVPLLPPVVEPLDDQDGEREQAAGSVEHGDHQG